MHGQLVKAPCALMICQPHYTTIVVLAPSVGLTACGTKNGGRTGATGPMVNGLLINDALINPVDMVLEMRARQGVVCQLICLGSVHIQHRWAAVTNQALTIEKIVQRDLVVIE